jgi:hypothetical protein
VRCAATRHRRSTGIWRRYCGTTAKAGGNRENKLPPVVTEGSCLLEQDMFNFCCLCHSHDMGFSCGLLSEIVEKGLVFPNLINRSLQMKEQSKAVIISRSGEAPVGLLSSDPSAS